MTTEYTIENARRLLPHLVRYAKSHQTVTYNDLADEIGRHHRAIPHALGYIRDDICTPRQLPFISAIVVNAQSGKPGVSVFADRQSDLSNSADVQRLREAQEAAFKFGGWDALLVDLGLASAAEPEEIRAAEEMLEELAGKSRGGGGWSTDAVTRTAIENHAMRVAEEHYGREGWSCRDVSRSESYDLHLSRGGQRDLRVEVKGTRSDGSLILLTRKEVRNAQEHYPDVALFVVHDVEVRVSPDGQPEVSGGRNVVYERWDIGQGTLEPLAFQYTVPAARPE